jgi:voltage-gated potassium channel Kch
MKEISFMDRVRYRFDNTMSRGPVALILWLFTLSIVLVAIVTVIVFAARIGPEGEGFFTIAWITLMRAIDAGAVSGDEGSWPFLFSMLAITIGGIFTMSILIGILTSAIEEKLGDLRKGRSLVAETGHTVILGWSAQVFTVISELVIANANKKRASIVILAENDKVEMEDEISDRIPDTGTTRIVCRTGSPMDMNDLAIVNPDAARSIIILAPEDSDEQDVSVIKTILALTNSPDRKPGPYHIVVAISEEKNRDVAAMVGGGEVELILSGDLIARISAQTCRQSGLSVVYGELLDFGGDEIYFKEEPALVGRTFGEAVSAFEDSTIVGIRQTDGAIRLTPPMETAIRPGDAVIAISRDDDTIVLSGKTDYEIDHDAVRTEAASPPQPERTLIIGWNRKALTIIRELDGYVAPGSRLTVFTRDGEISDDEFNGRIAESPLDNMTVSLQRGDTTDRKLLNRLDLYSYNHVIVLGYSDTQTVERADACTLVTLLHLRDIEQKTGRTLNIVSEMLDVRNRELAEITQADDFIVSNKLISLIMTQISENKDLAPVFAELFDPKGSEIYIKPVHSYVQTGKPVNYYTVVESARKKGEIALGYRTAADSRDAARSYGVTVNPNKSAVVTFEPDDRIIVLAGD